MAKGNSGKGKSGSGTYNYSLRMSIPTYKTLMLLVEEDERSLAWEINSAIKLLIELRRAGKLGLNNTFTDLEPAKVAN